MRTTVISVVALMMCAGCASDSVLFSTGTVVGFETSTGEANGSGVTLGYKRQEFVSMPMRGFDAEKNKKVVLPAFSTLALFNFETEGLLANDLGEHELQQVFATGKAAKLSITSGAAEEGFRALRELPSGAAVSRQRDIREMIGDADDGDRAQMVAVVSDVLAGGNDLGDPNVVRSLIDGRYSDPDEHADAIDDLVTHPASPVDVALELVDWATQDGDDDKLDEIRRRLEEISS